ncbi:MAG: tRNA (adenosine(37)-N6)-threonylcarbamoyltransferase complex ATPase subunit type 1 TsaE [Thermodesulfobacteriota bacterium]
MRKEVITNSLEQTIELGQSLGKTCQGGEVIALAGELGAGKTYFVKGLASGLDVEELEEVVSPSFIILREHKGRVPLYHIDFYRLESNVQVVDIGLEEFFYGPGVCAVEWAEKFSSLLPDDRLDVKINILGEQTRKFELYLRGKRFDNLAGWLVQQER